MLILALESSAKPASVAVCSDGELLGQYYQNNGLTHSRTLLAMAKSLLTNLDITISDIGLVAVSRGPGSFTGVRIGVAAAKGLAWGLNIPVCGVSTLESMAYQTPEQGVLLCPVMDARRNQVYNAVFQWRDGILVRLCDDRAISLADLVTELRTSFSRSIPSAPSAPSTQSTPLTPSASPVPCAPSALSTLISPNASDIFSASNVAPSQILLIGDGAAISFDYLLNNDIPCKIAPNLMRWQTAYGVALAACHADPIPAIELEPSYLRPSQAERERF